MLKISEKVTIPSREIDINAVRSQGAGGQNVNKVSTAIHLRFDIKAKRGQLKASRRKVDYD